jgi:hypothetical protein
MPPLDLYARVRISLHRLAHEIAGAARTRLSLRPLLREGQTLQQTSGTACRENAHAHSLAV